MKILYITTIGATMTFFQSFIHELVHDGHAVDVATNDSERKVAECYKTLGCRIFSLSCSRSPFDKGNIKAIGQIRKLVEAEKYDIVHCHTPIAAMCTRIACRKLRKNGTKVFYTAHGFHFYKGAPVKNWLVYYPVEWLCAHFTDVLITINQEDYALAQKHMHAKRVEYIPGVGVDVEKFANVKVDRNEKRRELGIPEDAFLMLSVGELNENKNHQLVINAIAKLKNQNIHYAIAGKGELHDYLVGLAHSLGVSDQIYLLGYRIDVMELYKSSDLYVLPSIREGLNVSIMEAMASGLPVVCGNIRGNVDLVDETCCVLFDPHNIEECGNVICNVIDKNLIEIGKNNSLKIKQFDFYIVNELMRGLYRKV